MIAFIGSVFSPYYARAIARTSPAAENYAAMNVALYRPNRWAMTERRARSVQRQADHLQIGPSALNWDGNILTANINEITVPVPRRLRGQLELTPMRIEHPVYNLDAQGRHRWRPIAPRARIKAKFEHPSLSWQGHAYLDSNDGDVPLAADFSAWNWLRAEQDGNVSVLYDVRRQDGTTHGLAFQFDPAGMREFVPPPIADLPRSWWGVPRQTRADPGSTASVLQEFESAPFYTRSKIATQLHGQQMIAIHESLDLARFNTAWVRCLLPFRMPRVLS